MKIVSVFNNKGGVGKTTLTFHLAHALGELGKKVLIVDLDPQCNITIFCMDMHDIEKTWAPEDPFIEDFQGAVNKKTSEEVTGLLCETRTIHFLLKPTEDGISETNVLPVPWRVGNNVDLLPGRLTLHLFEAKLAERWGGIYQGDPLSIRTATQIRKLAFAYAEKHNYDIVLFDTSPSLGALNKDVLSMADGFIVPCAPDLFSLYGIRNIGSALRAWKSQFDSIFHLLSDAKRGHFPQRFVQFLGYTIYNARKYSSGNDLDLAQAHYIYAKRIPDVISVYIAETSRSTIDDSVMKKSIGDNSVIHSHNTLPSMAQKYHVPMWLLPDSPNLESDDKTTISGNSNIYRSTRKTYHAFAKDFLHRVESLDR
jgi:cellulose biosynthesis protein BcsQ